MAQAQKQIGFGRRQVIFQSSHLQVSLHQLSLPVELGEHALSCQCRRADACPLVAQLLGTGQQRNAHQAVAGRVHQKTVELQTVFLVFLLVPHMLVKVVIVLKDAQLHLNGLGQAGSLGGDQRTLALHIIVNRRVQSRDALRETDVFQVEHKVLAPADFRIHAKGMFLNNGTAIQLIPEHAVIVIRRALHHMGRKLFRAHDSLFLDITFPGYPLADHPVEIRDDQITASLFRRPHQKLGGIGRHPVVAVQKLNVSSPGLGQSLISGR